MARALVDAPPDNLVSDLAGIVGGAHVLVGDDVRGRWDGYPPVRAMEADCIVRPGSTDEVAAIAAYCDRHGVALVPQGSRTGLVA